MLKTSTSRALAAILLIGTAILLLPSLGKAQAPGSAALTGRVSSKEEGPMEGVLVTAKKTGATMTLTVATDQQGRYSFPASKLEPGEYSLTIRAVGYDMDPAKATVAKKTAAADLQLHKTQDLAAQLTNAEWLQSMPGHPMKEQLLNCTMCHTLQRIVYSKHDADEFTKVIQRMSTYYIGSSPALTQVVPAFQRNAGNVERFRKAADFWSSVNLSKASKWEYSLKPMARPTGRSTRMIVTEYELPNKLAQPHDVIIASDGMAWYMDFGEALVGRLDPKTGQVTEFPVPVLKPEQPKGGLEIGEDNDKNIWVGMQFQAGIARFNRNTQKFDTFPLDKEYNSDTAQISMVVPTYSHVDGKVWVKEAGTDTQIKRLDIKTAKYEAAKPFPQGFGSYGISADTQNNCYFMDLGGEHIGRVDAKTMEVKFYKTPTADSGPRRGHSDSQDRLWFAEFRGNKVAMFDPKTEKIQEWPLPTPWTNPYDAVLDKNGDVWTGGMTTDRIVRVNTKTGQVTEYLMPQETNVRRVFVDNSTNPVTFWVGNDHHASIVKLEPMD